ncbi:hypothetical protein CW674_08615 [Macrococcoides caseolyticum]|uniref:polysaccharide pyruvyl transferase family protein n=1 Tax=Macrococcoides caseolyticum TaxID=69966 RepID=UPI000C34A076|nr:polysaccharide pyruvyl transferase family protein [Macrococcus caseolyticus]PKE65097.1 hypothetical protein CW674_08615 [Macrococcus caseolyticus]
MKNRVIIAFFNSMNIGDRLLAKRAIEIYSKEEINLIGIDFTSGQLINCSDYHVFSDKITEKVNNLNSKKLIKINRNTILYKYLSLMKYQLKKSITKELIKNKNIFKEVDQVIFTTGNMIMDINPAWPYIIKEYIRFFKGKDIFFSYVGVGPFDMKISKFFLKKSLKEVKCISVRDNNSKLELSKLNYFNVKLSLDPILYDNSRDDYNNKGKNIGICILNEVCFRNKIEFFKYTSFLNKLLLYLNVNNLEYVIFSTDKIDYKTLSSLKNVNKNNIYHINNYEDLDNLYRNIKYLIGGRMHSMILAQSKRIPFLGFNWQKKVEELFINVKNQKLYEVTSLDKIDIDENFFINESEYNMKKVNLYNNNIIEIGSLLERIEMI